jgi:hypothetical protein
VAAALVALEPMTRADASLYTDEALESLVKPRDVRQVQALAADVLPEDRLMLEDGSSGSGSGAAVGKRRRAEAVPADWAPPPQLGSAGSSAGSSSAAPKTGYGIPGAVRGAASAVLPPLQEEEGSGNSSSSTSSTSSGSRTIRPASESDIIAQQAERGKRRSGWWDGGEKK